MKTTILALICMSLLLFGNVATADENQEIVRAKIGIELRAGRQERPARNYEQVAAGNRFRIHVQPEPEPAFIYVIYADQQTVMLLNGPEQIKNLNNSELILPARDELYEFDAECKEQSITIICSPFELPEIASSDLSFDEWKKLEQQLIEKSRIPLDDPEVSRPWSIAGKVQRSGLKIYSGKSLVLNKYEFEVLKP